MPAMQLTLFTFRPHGLRPFELWAPREMAQIDAPENDGALIVQDTDGFAPNLVLGHNPVDGEMTLEALSVRLEADASALPGAKLHEARTMEGSAGEIRIVAFHHDGTPESGPIYQMTACMLILSAGDDPAFPRDLVFFTGSCTVEQMGTWDPVFVDAVTSVRFG
jgi:hypothetical protein